jgi:hypothetical protein
MIADSVVLVAVYYIERGMKAERKVREMEAEHVKQHKESDKAANRAQQMASRQNQRNGKGKGGGGTGPNLAQKYHNIQQPSKRD